jgi:SAM-dependent methyltransferase
MSEQFYSDGALYDRLFPGGEQAVDFYRAEADRQGGCVLELGCGTGRKLIPIASDGHPCVGIELSPGMLAEAQRKADERAVAVEWVQGDMRDFDLGRTFDLVLIAANSLLHLHEAGDLVSCFRSVRKHLAPGARLVFDVFKPSVRMLAHADGVRRRRDALSFVHPDHGAVHVDVAETYDAAEQVTRGTWYFSTDSEVDFLVAPLDIREHLPPGAAAAALTRRSPGCRTLRRLVPYATHGRCGDPALRLRIRLNREVPQAACGSAADCRSCRRTAATTASIRAPTAQMGHGRPAGDDLASGAWHWGSCSWCCWLGSSVTRACCNDGAATRLALPRTVATTSTASAPTGWAILVATASGGEAAELWRLAQAMPAGRHRGQSCSKRREGDGPREDSMSDLHDDVLAISPDIRYVATARGQQVGNGVAARSARRLEQRQRPLRGAPGQPHPAHLGHPRQPGRPPASDLARHRRSRTARSLNAGPATEDPTDAEGVSRGTSSGHPRHRERLAAEHAPDCLPQRRGSSRSTSSPGWSVVPCMSMIERDRTAMGGVATRAWRSPSSART